VIGGRRSLPARRSQATDPVGGALAPHGPRGRWSTHFAAAVTAETRLEAQELFSRLQRARLVSEVAQRLASGPVQSDQPQTMRLLGVSRQTVWQRVKRGEIDTIHVKQGRKKGLRLKLLTSQPDLFAQPS
jgi:biotin operon repressor